MIRIEKPRKNKHCHKQHTFSKLIMSSQVKKEDSNVYSFSTVLLLMYHLHEKIKAISFMSSHNKLTFWFIMICKCVFKLGVNCQAIFGVSMSAFTLLQKVSLVGHIIVFCNDKTFLYPILIKSWTQMLFGRNNTTTTRLAEFYPKSFYGLTWEWQIFDSLGYCELCKFWTFMAPF